MGRYPEVRAGRQLSGDERRRQVLDAAVLAVVHHGYESVRLRDVAREANVSTGLIQHYFESREQLLLEMFDYAIRGLIDPLVATAASKPPWQVLEQVIVEVTDPVKALTWTEFAGAAARHDEPRKSFREVYEQWQTLVGDTIARGTADKTFTPTLPLPEITNVLVAYVDGSLLGLASRTDVVTPAGIQQGWRLLAGSLLHYEAPQA